MKKVMLIIPDAENPFFISIATQLQRKLSFSKKPLIVLSSDNSIANELHNIEIVKHEQTGGDIDGLVFISSGANIESYEKIESLSTDGDTNLPVVIVDREVVNPEKYKCNVLCNNVKGAFLAADFLKKMGHVSVGMVTGKDGTDPAAARFQGFNDGCESNDLIFDAHWVFQGDFTFLSGRNAAASFLQIPSDARPSAVFCANDLSAAGFIQAVSESGVTVPDDISVIGFDGSPISGWLNPSLTTVVQPISRIVEHVEYALFFEERNEMNKKLQKVMWVEPTLAHRHSVKSI